MYICKLQTHHEMDPVQTTNKSCWWNFGFFYMFFLSFLCVPRAFFGRNCVCFWNNKLFRHPKSPFLRV